MTPARVPRGSHASESFIFGLYIIVAQKRRRVNLAFGLSKKVNKNVFYTCNTGGLHEQKNSYNGVKEGGALTKFTDYKEKTKMKFKIEVREDYCIPGRYVTDQDLIMLDGLYKSPILEVKGEKSLDELLEYGLQFAAPYIAHMGIFTTIITTFKSAVSQKTA